MIQGILLTDLFRECVITHSYAHRSNEGAHGQVWVGASVYWATVANAVAAGAIAPVLQRGVTGHAHGVGTLCTSHDQHLVVVWLASRGCQCAASIMLRFNIDRHNIQYYNIDIYIYTYNIYT